MNKYQEALDFMSTNLILTCKDNGDFYQMINDAKTTLQEALDELEGYKERERYEYEQWEDRQ